MLGGTVKMALYQGNIYSNALNMTTQLWILYPDDSSAIPMDRAEEPPKVLFALHGASGNAGDWIRMTSIEYYAQRYNYAVIMPEVQLSFYSDMKYGADYLKYVGEELPKLVSRTFNLNTARENLYIAGLSMGGYGAAKTAFTYPETFAGAASFSGVVSIQAFLDELKAAPEQFPPACDIRKMQGIFGEQLKCLPADDLFELVKPLAHSQNRPKYLQTCGTDDTLYKDNLLWRDYLDKMNYGHTYLEWKDGHTFPFWDRSVEFAMRFFAGEQVSANDHSAYGYGCPGDGK